MTSTRPSRITLDIDLSFSVSIDSELISGTVSASGSAVTVFVDNPAAFLAGRASLRGGIPDIASGLVGSLADEGLTVTVEGPKGVLVSVGAVRPSLLSRLASGSTYVRLGGIRALLNALRRSPGSPQISMPPSTMFPIVPTVSRRVRRRVTTTHYLRGSGRPRLIFVVGSKVWDGTPPREFVLLDGTTVIGSGAEADLQLDGLELRHAEIRHDENDDYVFHLLTAPPQGQLGSDTRGLAPRGRILRTGARIELGPWRMGFFREEFADHGRPYGGRVGGELARQKRQPGPRGERA
ncbi:hypothetical protein GCM10007382_01270 [Salinibacterium xinjiangense]|uniref:FHA domain-containing protein n=1 Tax=Salinibacterium xinjiangense TaxID=386302 RepID=A0A2C9A2W1_9MICO|nr:FHA domain-containing protein [Salinibacterium xinjiangense]GGK85116.1 hypothetical protein GCM10007382_01270 [Salinibacterium xinjiangense]SOE73707.1 hypothetical protein SAMN06296378_2812 [Salinibacterium xinjiangense]